MTKPKRLESPGLLSSLHRSSAGPLGRLSRVKDALGLMIGLGGPLNEMPVPPPQSAIVKRKEEGSGEGGRGKEGFPGQNAQV